MTDFATNGVTHSYWVTAVDSRFGESIPAGPGDRMTRLRNEDGFTLAEMLVGALLMLIVMSASLGVLDNLRRLGTAHGSARRATGQGAQASRELSRSLRNVAPSPEFPAVIERGNAFDLVFRAVDRPRTDQGANARNLMRVRYCLDASDPDRARLLEQTQRWNTQTAPAMPTGTRVPPRAGALRGSSRTASRTGPAAPTARSGRTARRRPGR